MFVLAYGYGVIRWVPSALEALGIRTSADAFWIALLSLWAALPIFLPAGLVGFLIREFRNPPWVLAIAGTIGFVEWAWDRHSLAIPWAHLGHSQIGSDGISQLAVIGGVPLVSAFAAAMAATSALLFERVDRDRVRLGISVGSGAICLHFAGLTTVQVLASKAENHDPVRVLIAQPNIPRSDRWISDFEERNVERLAALSRSTISASGRRPNLVVWPENLITTPLDQNIDLRRLLQREVDWLGAPLALGLVSLPRQSPSDRFYRSSTAWWAPYTGLIDEVYKERAIPIVERRPLTWIEQALARFVFDGATYQWVETTPQGADLIGEFSLTPVLCWEVLFDDLVASRRGTESRFLLNLADDSWVDTEAATQQLTAFSRFRAIEQRLPLIRVAHGGLSVVVDRFGRISDRLPMDEYASTVVEIPPPAPASAMEKLGIVLLPLLTGFIVWFSWPPAADFLRQRLCGVVQERGH